MKQRLPLLIRASLMFARDIVRSIYDRARASIPGRLIRSARRGGSTRHDRRAISLFRTVFPAFISAIANFASGRATPSRSAGRRMVHLEVAILPYESVAPVTHASSPSRISSAKAGRPAGAFPKQPAV